MKKLLIEIDKGMCGFYDWLLFGERELSGSIFASYWIDAFVFEYFSFYRNRWDGYYNERIK